ncbi:30S ribosomal protein S9 [Anaerococcus sp. AGMB00486]|uniref:Small ribosomal subunit protein uS9 n=2 Tax=Anaerococcus TaxID=165779 RepID=A0ABX2NBU1_9FIRM|nr:MULTISPECIES: 30S ribosomal protein S9 [Anaerococcus]MDY3006609.1 30S ribosomal protein S9 [Anaerococcus porci]MSS78079.1 30S ribosomal protein S9 [Anaerococcus porci]NVF12118.1 30S ribosomal protein S9 [Anaerococcus faecalis]
MADIIYQATGRRKTSVARVTMKPGSGSLLVNGRDLDDYFAYDTLKVIAKAPLKLTENESNYDIKVNVKGGGFNGQAGAIRHAIARALLEVNPEYRKALKRAGFLTRDSRKKERYKYGQKKARKSSQFSKR